MRNYKSPPLITLPQKSLLIPLSCDTTIIIFKRQELFSVAAVIFQRKDFPQTAIRQESSWSSELLSWDLRGSALLITKAKLQINKWRSFLFPAVTEKPSRSMDQRQGFPQETAAAAKGQGCSYSQVCFPPPEILGTPVIVIPTLRSLSTQRWENQFSLLKGNTKNWLQNGAMDHKYWIQSGLFLNLQSTKQLRGHISVCQTPRQLPPPASPGRS